MLIAMLLAAAAPVPDVHLICVGGGNQRTFNAAQGFAIDNHGNSVTASGVASGHMGYSDQVTVSIEGGAGRITLPRNILPLVHGGDGSSMELKNLSATDEAITGQVGINFMNKPRVRIDRISGNISIVGKNGSFTGTCEPFDPKTVQRKF